ncbi:hypothetical protein ACFPYJ_30560 [Paenibacillus solisilvae]|uniref:Uncharacterized protein n=1 Tax=Paenibacillus solisilvae TaxID=2486751 RepID=A0ABW0W593_9BACL
MPGRCREMKWFDDQEEIKHLFQHSFDRERLLAISENEELVQKVVTYLDSIGQMTDAKGYVMQAREMIASDPQANNWVYIVFDHGLSIKIIAGPIGDSQAIEWQADSFRGNY